MLRAVLPLVLQLLMDLLGNSLSIDFCTDVSEGQHGWSKEAFHASSVHMFDFIVWLLSGTRFGFDIVVTVGIMDIDKGVHTRL